MSKNFDELQARNQWNSDPKIRQEFNGDEESYIAYKRAESQGRIRVLGGQK